MKPACSRGDTGWRVLAQQVWFKGIFRDSAQINKASAEISRAPHAVSERCIVAEHAPGGGTVQVAEDRIWEKLTESPRAVLIEALESSGKTQREVIDAL